MKLYNTLTRTVEEFAPLHGDNVRVYSCGPTVYDHIHIGNLSAFIVADTLRRTLKASGYNTMHVMNFTDVDDKTIRRSHEQYPDMDPGQALTELTEHYSALFLEDVQAVGNNVQDYNFIKATDKTVIAGMQQLIRELHENGFAYIADDGVYFSIDAYKKSGKTYGQLSEIASDSTSEARIQNDEYDKESAHDFALWKKQKDGEPAWEFKIGGHGMQGRPGWHIECSVMSAQGIGLPFDIHTGGIDLIFPHHENEIAQSTAGKDNPMYAKYFVHNEHILVDGKKMSKSLNNFYTLRDIVNKGYEPLAFRLLVLQSHYRSQAHFSWENLDAAQNRLHNWQAVADMRWQRKPKLKTQYDLLGRLQDDLNTPLGLAVVDSVLNMFEVDDSAPETNVLEQIKDLLGIDLFRPDITDQQKQLISARTQAREIKDWAKSDELRDELLRQGVGIRDTAHGTIWYRVQTA